jgi:hypothetical protein
MSKPPFAQLDFAPPAVDLQTLDDGSMVLRSPLPLGDHPCARWPRRCWSAGSARSVPW